MNFDRELRKTCLVNVTVASRIVFVGFYGVAAGPTAEWLGVADDEEGKSKERSRCNIQSSGDEEDNQQNRA